MTIGLMYWFGHLSFLESKVDEARFRLLEREARDGLVLVEIDALSLRKLDVWPWPRGFHAQLIETLHAAGAARIALDIDLSSRSTPEQDRALEGALAAAGGRVILPAFMQAAPEGSAEDVVVTAPLEAFARHAALASVNVSMDPDGRARRFSFAEPWGEIELPSLFALLAAPEVARSGAFHVDFGIRQGTIARISYVDILLGNFDPQLVAGKRVLVGATAIELGDRIPVPVYGVLPGVVLQALAYQSAVQGRTLTRIGRGPILAGAAIIALLLGLLFDGWSWRRGLLVLCAATLALLLLGVIAQAAGPLILDVIPGLLSIFSSYAIALIRRINQQDLRLLAQRLTIWRQEAFVAQVVENSFDGILTIDEQGVVKSANRSAGRILRHDAASMVGCNIGDLMPAQAMERSPGGPVDALRPRSGHYELQGNPEDGLPLAVELVVSEAEIADESIVIALLRDTTAQRLAEARAERNRTRLQEAIECINEGFALYDRDDRLVLCNQKFRVLLFQSAEPLPGEWRFVDVMRACAREGRVPAAEGRVEEWVGECLERRSDPSSSFEGRLVDGTCLQVSERRTHDGGTVAIYADITELKQREESMSAAVETAQTASRAKTEFLANMSHELRTPLNAIIGFAEMMLTQTFGPVGSPKYKEYVEDIHYSGTHLLGIINDVLDVSRIEAGKHKLDEETIEVGPVVEACLRLVQDRAQAARHEILVEISEDLPALHADERALKQILLNLLSNAVKFTPDGGTITIEALVSEQSHLIVRVIDTGTGMASDEIPRALALFGQIDSDLARRYEGTGLGLPLAQRLMELHGGFVWVDSEVGVGTIVTIEFPAERVVPAGSRMTALGTRR